MSKIGDFIIDVVFAIFTLVLMALTSVNAEINCANGYHAEMWAEVEFDSFAAGD